ncbi:DUF5908 family protein [Undibacterium sp. TJN19]|uniref:DUF5908 family protein n=1 Tax=Undibacterium sp. TJN19 TaxID=3413055 RepID=UPI003BF2146F
MSIEIKQLLIKATIVQSEAQENRMDIQDKQVQKEEILLECKQLILSLLRERGER